MDFISFISRRLEESDSGNLWVVGVVLVLLGSIGQNLGNNLVSVAHSSMHDEEDGSKLDAIKEDATEKGEGGEGDAEKKEEEEDWMTKNLWLVGTCIFVGGSLMTFVAFGFDAQSLLASLESVQFVSNIVFAKLVHKEEVTWTMILATLGIVGGNTLVVLFSEHGASSYTGNDIFAIWRTNTAFHIYLGAMGGVAIICEYIYRTYNHARMVDRKLLAFHSFLEPAAYCIASAFVGAFAVVNAKCISMFLTGGDAGGEFAGAPMWVVLITWIAVVAFWLNRMDHGLELFQPLFFIPVLMVFFVFFSIICGGIFFEEFNSFSASQFAGFFSGVSMILLGVFFLAPSNDMEVGPAPAGEGEGTEPVLTGMRLNTMRRLSFSALYDDVEISDTDGDASGKPRAGSVARGRTTTMSHPLAALKEAHHRASLVPAFANVENAVSESVTRTTRRLSSAIGLGDLSEAQKSEIAKDMSAEEEPALSSETDLDQGLVANEA
jgi:magnesium transporter